MDRYTGVAGDKPLGGGSFIDEEGYGYEMFNFRPFRGRVYGFVEVLGRITLERLGSRADAEYLSGVTVIFVAPLRGRSPHVIVGWYRNATIYRSYQNASEALNRVVRGKQIGFNLAAAHKDSVLLSVDDRVFQVPRGKGGIGQARLWYADQPRQRRFLQKVREYIKTRKPPLPYTGHAKGHGAGWQPDLEQRQRVERAAVGAVWDHFAAHGYDLRRPRGLNEPKFRLAAYSVVVREDWSHLCLFS
jgi:hypothetical protein